MKYRRISILIAVIFFGVAGAGVVDTMWLKIYPGSDSASGNLNQATDIKVDRDGNVYVCGSGEKAVPGNNDMLVAKFNQFGETLWVRSYGTNGIDDIAQAMAIDSSGNVYLVGATEYSAPWDLDITWLKYDPNGNLLWARRSMFPDDDVAYDIVIGNQGDVYLCGAVSDTHFVLSAFFVARINPQTGDTIWTRRYILDTNALASSRRQDRHPDFVLFDWDQWDNCATAMAVSPDSGHIVVTGFGYSDNRSYQIWTMKFLPGGTRRWAHEYWRSLDYDDVGFDVAVADNGYIFVAGFDENDANYYDALILRYAPTGGAPITRRVNDPMDDEDYFFAITLDDSNPQNVYATGAYYQSTTSRFDIITYKANSGLTPRWGNAGAIYATSQDDYGFDIEYNNGRIYVAGQRGSDVVVLCYSASNAVPHETLWTWTYNSPYNQTDLAAGVCVLDTDRVFIAGQVARTVTVGGPTDLLTARLFYPYPDMSVSEIVAPADTVVYFDTVMPQVRLVNTGNTIARFSVRLRIGAGYDQTVNWNNPVYPGDSCTATFPQWIAQPLGDIPVACSVALAGDRNSLNDIVIRAVTVVQLDAGCSGIIAPRDTVDSGALVQPRVWVHNYSSLLVTVPVQFRIGDGYQQDTTVTLAPGESAIAVFPNWHARRSGTWAIRCSTMLAHDGNHGNDHADGVVVVRPGEISWPPGWVEVASMPLLPSARPVKDGAWLVADEEHGVIYAAKGYKTGDFYAYHPLSNSWVVLSPWLAGREGKLTYRGSTGCYGDGFVYATRGNNTFEFWRYSVASGEWEQLADVLAGRAGNKVKGGSDLVYVEENGTGYVYLLKGYKQDFMRYNTQTGSWELMPDAPAGIRAKWDKGSWLVYDGDQHLYAHKAKYHELWRFNLVSHQWEQTPLTGMPVPSPRTGKNKKSKDGGSAAWNEGRIYALKGGNTCEFWVYDTATQTWTELEPMPEVGSTGRKKRVKAGGDIVYLLRALWALKGNKTQETWRYGLVDAQRVAGGGVLAGASRLTADGNDLTVAPDYIRYTIAQPARVRLVVYDLSGRQRLVKCDHQHSAGTYLVELPSGALPAGVYFVQMEVLSGKKRAVASERLLIVK